MVAAAGLAALGAASFHNVSTYAFEYSQGLPRTRRYMENLTADLARLRSMGGEPQAFVDGWLPVHITGFDPAFRRHSQLFSVLHARDRFVDAREAEFAVDESGHIVRGRAH